MRRTVAGLTLVLALALTGCSAASAPDAAAPPAPGPKSTMGQTDTGQSAAPAATAPAAKAPLSADAAAKEYLNITQQYQAVKQVYEQAVTSGAPVAAQAGLAGATGDALRAEAEGLSSTEWPDDVKPHAAAISEAAIKAAAFWDDAAEAKTTDAVKAAVDKAEAVDVATDDTAVRQILKLGAGDAASN